MIPAQGLKKRTYIPIDLPKRQFNGRRDNGMELLRNPPKAFKLCEAEVGIPEMSPLNEGYHRISWVIGELSIVKQWGHMDTVLMEQ
jgi:hypothetical protein